MRDGADAGILNEDGGGVERVLLLLLLLLFLLLLAVIKLPLPFLKKRERRLKSFFSLSRFFVLIFVFPSFLFCFYFIFFVPILVEEK